MNELDMSNAGHVSSSARFAWRDDAAELLLVPFKPLTAAEEAELRRGAWTSAADLLAAWSSPMKPTSGRIVFYVSPDHGDQVVIRPALIIAPCLERFPDSNYQREECQLHVFWDGTNDGPNFSAPTAWRTSVPHDEDKKPGTWHESDTEGLGFGRAPRVFSARAA